MLRNALVAEKIAMVDRTGAKTIQSPYGAQPTVAVSALTGTYAVADYTTTDSTLTVQDEFKVAEQVFDFEETLANFSLFANRTNEQMAALATAIDKFVVNTITGGAGAAYTTPTGGFTTAANINVILSNLISKVSGYAEMYKGMYLVIENTDVVGFVQAQATNGFSFADAALNNGFTGSYMGVDVYVVKSGTFANVTYTGGAISNSGKRLFGIKNTATYASPQGIKFEEKGVSGKTGVELVTYGYVGAKVWDAKSLLTVVITLA
jgi:hypothetical protein